ncbi:hypothetical protein JVU11DRAFT_8282 [Chiua virens]|nr:hypothetical protein JVU11DRAFT_8282 [Chiua virens]
MDTERTLVIHRDSPRSRDVAFTAAVSISLPGSLSTSASPGSEPGVSAFPQINNTPAVGGQLSSLESKVENAVVVCDLKSDIDYAVRSIESKVDIRSTNTPSIAVIFNDLQTQIQPYIEELTFIMPSNISASLVEKSVSSINASVATAISRLQTLSGHYPSKGDGQLSVLQALSLSFSEDINKLFSALLNIVKAAAGADTNANSSLNFSCGVVRGLGSLVDKVLTTIFIISQETTFHAPATV